MRTGHGTAGRKPNIRVCLGGCLLLTLRLRFLREQLNKSFRVYDKVYDGVFV